MRPPRRDHFITPYTDGDSSTALDNATAALCRTRGFALHGDIGITLHALASLAAQIDHHITAAVTEARNQDYSWAQIGDLLGTTRASAWQRFAKPEPTPN